MKIRVAVGLSGGVDSAVSAYLLKEQGFDVSCVYLNCYDGPPAGGSGCRGDNDRKDALAVAMRLGLPFQVLDFRKEYQAAVIDYFKKEYLLGRTPNPDVVCNRDIKFGLFLDWAIKAGFDYMATGHYADGPGFLPKQKSVGTPASAEKRATSRERIVRGAGEWQAKAGATVLRIPKDLHKDQTYFLWAVPREKFSRVLFPLADYLKSEVRAIASRLAPLGGVADKPDSTGICFVGEVRVEDFLKSLGVKEKRGEVVVREKMVKMVEMVKDGNNLNNLNNLNPPNHYRYRVIGSHRGVWFYTIGQRHGFSTDLWSSKMNVERRTLNVDQRTTYNAQRPTFVTDCPPLYVIEKDIKKNRLIVGFGAETYREKFIVSNLNWLVGSEFFSQTQNSKLKTQNLAQSSKLEDIFVRIRHGGERIPCRLSVVGCQLSVALATPARGIAPGQSAVFYSKDGVVLGGGVIQ